MNRPICVCTVRAYTVVIVIICKKVSQPEQFWSIIFNIEMYAMQISQACMQIYCAQWNTLYGMHSNLMDIQFIIAQKIRLFFIMEFSWQKTEHQSIWNAKQQKHTQTHTLNTMETIYSTLLYYSCFCLAHTIYISKSNF